MTAAPRIRRNAAYALAAEASRAVLAATLLLVVTRVLGPSDFGLFALALSLGTVALVLADFGISPAVARFVAERRGDRPATAAVVADALRLKAAVAGAVALVVALGAEPIAALYDEPGLAGPIRWTALALFAQSLFTLCVFVAVAMGRVALQLVLFTGESIAETALVVAIVALGGGAAGAAGGRAAGFAVGALLGLALLVRLLGRDVRPRARALSGVRLAGYAGALFLVEAAWAVFSNIDVLLIGAYLEPRDVGLFDAIARFMVLFGMAGTAASSAISPRIARHEREAPAIDALVVGLRALIVLGAAVAAVLVAWAEPVIRLVLGEEYLGATGALRAAAPMMLLAVVAPLATTTVNYAGSATRRIPLVLAAVAINVVLDVLLIPRIGIIACSIATGAALALYVPGHLLLLRRTVGLPLSPLLRTTGRALVAAAALAGVLALLGTGDVGALRLAAGAVAGTAAYAAVLLLTRELRPAELAATRAMLRGDRR